LVDALLAVERALRADIYLGVHVLELEVVSLGVELDEPQCALGIAASYPYSAGYASVLLSRRGSGLLTSCTHLVEDLPVTSIKAPPSSNSTSPTSIARLDDPGRALGVAQEAAPLA